MKVTDEEKRLIEAFLKIHRSQKRHKSSMSSVRGTLLYKVLYRTSLLLSVILLLVTAGVFYTYVIKPGNAKATGGTPYNETWTANQILHSVIAKIGSNTGC